MEFIVELLTRPGGPSYKRSLPKSKEDAEALAAKMEEAGICAMIVPAEKYAPKLRESKADRPEETGPNNYRSRVE